jgi:hypothetical protein
MKLALIIIFSIGFGMFLANELFMHLLTTIAGGFLK